MAYEVAYWESPTRGGGRRLVFGPPKEGFSRYRYNFKTIPKYYVFLNFYNLLEGKSQSDGWEKFRMKKITPIIHVWFHKGNSNGKATSHFWSPTQKMSRDPILFWFFLKKYYLSSSWRCFWNETNRMRILLSGVQGRRIGAYPPLVGPSQYTTSYEELSKKKVVSLGFGGFLCDYRKSARNHHFHCKKSKV